MADLAHDASGPASSEPAGITQQAKRPTSSDSGKLRVFISYSRDDFDFADQLNAALDAYGFECLIDRHGISGGEDWKRRLGSLISEADTVVFVLSPSSAGSPICVWEVEEAKRLNKRILPIVWRPLGAVSPPQPLQDRNYIFFYNEPKVPSSGFGTGLASLITALNTDFDWLREHTRYLQRAIEWDTGGRPANRLLSGDDIRAANAWAAGRPKSAPEPTALQLDFIRASEQEAEARLSEQRKQLEEVGAAQAARETALHEAEEALKQAADAQRRRARIRNIALVVVSILAVFAGWLGWSAEQARIAAEEQRTLAEQQKRTAEQQRQQADDILARAEAIIVNLGERMDVKTQEEAFGLLMAGAIHGDVPSIYDVGVYYENGYGVAQDYAKAREWYEKAAAKNSAEAMGNLGLMYEKGEGVPQDYAKARELWERAAAEGNEVAMNNLGKLFAWGEGVTRDYAKAREWYEKAAAKDNAVAMNNLAILYHEGQGVAQDYVTEREWLEKAAAKDNADAMYYLALLYHNGQGVPQDDAKAREWLEKAAAKGDAGAMVNLGWLYEKGQGGPQDYAKAREWLEKAAAKGDAGAMVNLGWLYEKGQGGPQDYAKAREWYEKGADLGDAQAKMALEQLPIEEAETAGRYAEALRLEETLAAKVEAEETKREGKPGEQAGTALNQVVWCALFAKEFTKASTVSDRAHALFPNYLLIETNRAHALMFTRHDKEAKALYLAHKGEPVAGELWEQAIAEDFEKLRKAGLTNPLMADVEKELGISH